jgi:hypothetical protein
MNQKEIFINTLTRMTREKKLKWTVCAVTSKISRYIANADQISQIFTSEFNGSEIFFIVQKYITYSHDFDLHIEQFTKFVNVIYGTNLVYSVFENEVSENMLDELLSEISSTVENEFYNSFLKVLE